MEPSTASGETRTERCTYGACTSSTCSHRFGLRQCTYPSIKDVNTTEKTGVNLPTARLRMALVSEAAWRRTTMNPIRGVTYIALIVAEVRGTNTSLSLPQQYRVLLDEVPGTAIATGPRTWNPDHYRCYVRWPRPHRGA